MTNRRSFFKILGGGVLAGASISSVSGTSALDKDHEALKKFGLHSYWHSYHILKECKPCLTQDYIDALELKLSEDKDMDHHFIKEYGVYCMRNLANKSKVNNSLDTEFDSLKQFSLSSPWAAMHVLLVCKKDLTPKFVNVLEQKVNRNEYYSEKYLLKQLQKAETND